MIQLLGYDPQEFKRIAQESIIDFETTSLNLRAKHQDA
jgi:hypothetical protein